MSPTSNPRRQLPSVDALLSHPGIQEALRAAPRAVVVDAIRVELAEVRERLRGRKPEPVSAEAIAARAAARAAAETRPELRRVLNATGIVLHTNLGRAPLSAPACDAVGRVAAGYSTLEFDLEKGERGERGRGVERWLRRLTGAEDALVVNNGAAGLLLVLAALARDRKVVVSRGELIEIGGSFRIPEIMTSSGAGLIEIGTTNRTHLRDYAQAIARHDDIAAILRVHPSNFRVSGFTTRPTLQELSGLARKHRLPLIEDLGSGALVDLEPFGLQREPTVRESLNAGCDVVIFSGDKLLGATQAGLVLGRKRLMSRVRRDPLARALRVDKLTLAALEATLPAYSDPERAAREIPALAMLRIPAQALETRARVLAKALEAEVPAARIAVEPGEGEVGGGALPLQKLKGWVVAVEHPALSPDRLDALARGVDPPVIGYIRGRKYRLDVRTLTDAEVAEAAEALGRAWKHTGSGL